MPKMLAISAAIIALASSSALLADQPPAAPKPATTGQKAPGPCDEITNACKGAGFVEGDAKQGNGLWVDCIDPIMQGTKQPAKATKALPSVSPQAVAACKQKNPNFGEQKQKTPAKS
jgi:hypothetical protein